MKNLVEKSPVAWLRLAGANVADAELLDDSNIIAVDTDLATVTTTCDKVFRILFPFPKLIHMEFEAEGKNVPKRVHRYHVLIDYKYDTFVQSIVFLLRKEADSPEITGVYERFREDGTRYHHFEYDVIRLWLIPVEMILEGEIGILPLAPVSSVPKSKLKQVLRRMEERVNAELPPEDRDVFWTTTYLMMGLRYENEQSINLLKGVIGMTNSTTYMAIIQEGIEIGESRGEVRGKAEGKAEGEVSGLKSAVLRIGGKRFGPPSDEVKAQIESIIALEKIQELTDRILFVDTWTELLAKAN